MGCRCQERRASLQRAGHAVVRGQVRSATRELAASAQSFAQDVRTAQTRRQMLTTLANIRRR